MKVKIILDLDTAEHKLEINLLNHGVAMWCALNDLESALRSKYKYCDETSTTWEEVRELFYEHMRDYVNLGD